MEHVVYTKDIKAVASALLIANSIEDTYKMIQGLLSIDELKELAAEEVKSEVETETKEEVKAETPAEEDDWENVRMVNESADAEGKSLEEIEKMAKKHTYVLHNRDVRHAKKLIGAMKSWMNLEVKDDRSTRKACKIVWDDGTETEVKSYESAMKLISSTADKVITSDNISVKMLEGLVPMDITINIPARRKNWIKQGIEQLLIKVGTAVNNVKVVCLYSGN